MSEANESGRPRLSRISSQRLGAVTVVASVTLALVAAVLVYGKNVGLPWSADDSAYCWGAWEGENVPWHTNADPDDVRTTSDTPPTAENPTGTCEYLFAPEAADADADADGEPTPQYRGRVTVTYDRVPEREEDRLPWLTSHFQGRAAPLPDGLPGFVGEESGMVVLPARCDEDFRPTVLTLTTNSRSSAHDHIPDATQPAVRHSRSEIAKLLLAAARKGIEHAGCSEADQDGDDSGEDQKSHKRPLRGLEKAYDDRRYVGEDGYDPDNPRDQGEDEHAFRVDSPVLGDPRTTTDTRGALCGLTGMRKSAGVLGSPGNRYEWLSGQGVPGALSHVCSYQAVFDQPDLATDEHGMDRRRTDGLSLIATFDERLVKLLLAAIERDDNEELPGWDDAATYGSKDLAVARARCPAGADKPRDTLFVVVRSHPTKMTPAQVLPEYVTAVEKHLGCTGLAPEDRTERD